MIWDADANHVFSEIVTISQDNSCTTATAESIVGAIVGKSGVIEYWYRNFNNNVYSYLIGREKIQIDYLIERSTTQAGKRGLV